MKPIGDYIFITVEDTKEKATASGIILVSDAASREGASTGTITAVGPDVKGVKEGQTVVFNEHHFDHLFSDKENQKKIVVGKITGIYAVHD